MSIDDVRIQSRRRVLPAYLTCDIYKSGLMVSYVTRASLPPIMISFLYAFSLYQPTFRILGTKVPLSLSPKEKDPLSL